LQPLKLSDGTGDCDDFDLPNLSDYFKMHYYFIMVLSEKGTGSFYGVGCSIFFMNSTVKR
jgi:hypothetical protein